MTGDSPVVDGVTIAADLLLSAFVNLLARIFFTFTDVAVIESSKSTATAVVVVPAAAFGGCSALLTVDFNVGAGAGSGSTTDSFATGAVPITGGDAEPLVRTLRVLLVTLVVGALAAATGAVVASLVEVVDVSTALPATATPPASVCERIKRDRAF